MTDERPTSTFLLSGGRVIDPAAGIDGVRDVLVENGTIQAIANQVEVPAGWRGVTYDARGWWIVPGLFDMHVHFREPGFEEDETIETGSRCALHGGFTGVACMANTNPTIDEPDVTSRVVAASRRAPIDVHPVSAVTRGLRGETLVDFEAQARAGAIAFSDDGKPVANEAHMRAALERAGSLGRIVIQHAEVPSLFTGGCMHAGSVSAQLGVRGIPSEAEWGMVERDIAILDSLARGRARLHVAHVSTAGSVDRIRRAKARGLAVTAEVTPHHLTLTHERLAGADPNFKMNPPLREDADVLAVREGLVDGTIDCIASDHAPHSPAKKARGLETAPFGVIGLESTVPVVLTHLVHRGILDASDFVRRLSTRPREILFGSDDGRLRVGAKASIAAIDPDAPVVIAQQALHSKSRNCPFVGEPLRGRVVLVASRGVLHDLRLAD
ncbi:MAG: dihydroorotase [Planctomycetes bacterium]|nr:dihydroorotase [Planctomycetota bacterium]MBI3845045.1 dihydroorotase [Planctomycetota bacterium]